MGSIGHWIEHWATVAPDRVALEYEGRRYSYAELDRLVKTAAGTLRHVLGVRPGDRVAYLGQNHPRCLVLVFACAWIGAIYVPLNWRLTAGEHRYMLDDCDPRVFVVDAPYLAQSESFAAEFPRCRCVAAAGRAPAGWRTLETLPAADAVDWKDPDAGPASPLLIKYTSGTTGFPKGAVLTQEAVHCNALNSLLLHGMTGADVVLTVLPLFHVGGLNNQTTAAFYAGARVILHRTFDAQRSLDDLAAGGTTLTVILPAHMPPLRALPGWDAADFPRLRSVLTGSCTIPAEMTDHWRGRGVPLIQMYGASETSPIAIHQMPDSGPQQADAIGYPAMHCEIRLADRDGGECRPGEPGEILVRGRNVMTGYWNNEKATREALVDGWYHSGDLGYRDDQGCYHFIDRMRDVIVSGGENVYPAEVERVLAGHPDILEVAVVGRADPRWGETVVAAVVPRDGRRLDGAEIRQWLRGRLGGYKHPRDFLFMDALPRNEMRKVQKHVLREMVKHAAA
jgi:fatty-acyl-CoA synthase